MILSLFIGGGIVTWLTFIAASAWAHQYFKHKAAKEFSRQYTQAVDESFAAMIKSLDGVEDSIARKLESAQRLSDPRPTTRVYAFMVKRNAEVRMLVQPAISFEDMVAQVNKELGTGWLVTASAFVDVFPPSSESTTLITTTPEKEEKPRKSNFIHSLEYARDVFARTEPQKKVLDDIIKRIKQVEYGKSTTASGN